MVTVDRAADPGAQAAFIAELAGATRTGVSVKDSFERLDLAPMGFQILFEARWLWSERPAPPTNYGDLRWDRIGEEGRLAQWERAWRGADRNAERTFRADLLGDERVSILAGVDATGEIIGGGIGFRAAGVEGVTNLFGPRRAFIDALRAAGAAAPIVCYEQGDDLAAAIQTGSEPLGGLEDLELFVPDESFRHRPGWSASRNILAGYAAATAGPLHPKGAPSLLVNFVGASLILLSLTQKFNLSAAIVEGAWALIAG